jgi:hypothetical protein
MSDILIPIPKTSLEKLLKPVNRLTDACVLKSFKDDKSIHVVCSSPDNSVILYARTQIPIEIDPITLNIINIKKLMNGLECLGDGGEFKMIHKTNHIFCQSTVNNESNHFKYHLVDNNIIKEAPVNIQSIKKLEFDTVFELPLAKIKQIMSAYSFVNDVNKIYFYTKDDKVYAEIDDKTMQNIDNVSLVVADTYEGQPILTPLSIKIEIFKNLISSRNSIKVKINNQFKVFIFHTQEDENTELKYIISALVK